MYTPPKNIPEGYTMSNSIRENSMKSGTKEYAAVHRWVYRNFGGAKECEHCDNPTSKTFDWANISGQYLRERSDWARLCRPCHAKLDRRRPYCAKGHEYTPENSYFNPRGHRFCRQCARDFTKRHRINFYEEVKEMQRNYANRRNRLKREGKLA